MSELHNLSELTDVVRQILLSDKAYTLEDLQSITQASDFALRQVIVRLMDNQEAKRHGMTQVKGIKKNIRKLEKLRRKT